MPAETHVERSPMGPDEVLAILRERLAEILEIEEVRVTRDARFVEDLDADSLALIELVETLEEELGERTVGFTVDDEDLAELHTVGEAVDYIVGRLGTADGIGTGMGDGDRSP
jgi:acyl carrier protein